MQVLSIPTDLTTVVFDVDGTLHQNIEYLTLGERNEDNAIAQALNIPLETAIGRMMLMREQLEHDSGSKTTRTAIIQALGLTRHWWNEVRVGCFKPEMLEADPEIVASIRRASERYRIVAATNNPHIVGRNALTALGFDTSLPIIGPEDTGVSKPDPQFFARVAELINVDPCNCLSIGDRLEADGKSAQAAGMGAVIVSNVFAVRELCETLCARGAPFKFDEFIPDQFESGTVKVVRSTGRAGAGKTTIAARIHGVCKRLGIPSFLLSLDTFFRLSSKARKAWLEEGRGISIDEYNRRCDQMLWWNFDRAREALDTLAGGRPLHLTNVYNRDDGGELTGRVDIEPDERGAVIAFEGVAVAHLNESGGSLLHVHAPAALRKMRLVDRDHNRRPDPDAAAERWRITEEFESNYFAQHNEADTFLDNTGNDPHRMLGLPAFASA